MQRLCCLNKEGPSSKLQSPHVPELNGHSNGQHTSISCHPTSFYLLVDSRRLNPRAADIDQHPRQQERRDEARGPTHDCDAAPPGHGDFNGQPNDTTAAQAQEPNHVAGTTTCTCAGYEAANATAEGILSYRRLPAKPDDDSLFSVGLGSIPPSPHSRPFVVDD